MKTHWKKVFDKDYLGACDLDEGKDLKAIIKRVEVREVKSPQGAKQKRNVAIFEGIKPMILNVTNSKIVASFAGSPYIEDWVNVGVQIYVKGDVQAFGETTEGLRIRKVQPKMSKQELLPDTKYWSNAVAHLKKGNPITDITKYYEVSESNIIELKKQAQ